ncbi:MAG: queuosine precursor transporter [Pseudomonadota bacterium]|nr:queuosine precursor transporter [Pseudomonadota bacterium]
MTDMDLAERRERVFFILAGIFLCAMTMLNIIGITRFVQIGPMSLAVGVLPYPLTFLCTDLISELYGRSRANFVVWVGLGLNFFILGTMWLAQALPSVTPDALPPWQVLKLQESVALPNGDVAVGSIEFFQLLYYCTSGAVFASMMAYIAAQFCDVQLFHFWKRLTRGRHLWLRNNFSTLASQLVDSIMVVSVTFGAAFFAGDMTVRTILVLIGSNYLFKMFVAIADTGPFYLATHWLRNYLQFEDPTLEYARG